MCFDLLALPRVFQGARKPPCRKVQRPKNPGPRNCCPGPRKKLDHASYSFDELRAAFLERVHEIHPDKRRGDTTETDTSGHHEFVELQSAWAEYEKLAKMMMTKVGSGSSDANFTLFGVGCSFSDNESVSNNGRGGQRVVYLWDNY